MTRLFCGRGDGVRAEGPSRGASTGSRVPSRGAVALEASRVVADPDELPKVIREKQLCKKMLAWLEGRVECTSSSLRPVGSG